MIKLMIWRIFTAPIRFYYMTWSFILALFGKRTPKHIRDYFKNEVNDPPLGKIESYRQLEK